MATPAALRRALLYVPASSAKMVAKSLTLTHCDNITYDLEDSVTAQNKNSARLALHEHLSRLTKSPPSPKDVAIRINAISTPYALADLTALACSPCLSTIILPKVNSASDLTFVTDALRHLNSRPIKLLALIESARAVMDLAAICAASPLLDGLVFAAEDFALDLSLIRTPSLNEFLYARSAIVTAASAFNLSSTIDLVCTAYRGPEGVKRLREECQNGREMGFNGKQCIHPSQVETVQTMFSPGGTEVDWAVRLVVASEKAKATGRGAWTLDGHMVDAPIVGKAQAVVARAAACGLDVNKLRAKWLSQEPE